MDFHVGNSDNIFHTTHNDDRRSFTTAQKLLQPLQSIIYLGHIYLNSKTMTLYSNTAIYCNIWIL